jgi:hypothetical protein
MTMISYKRKFEVDDSLTKGIKKLNKAKFYTVGCCSGLKKEHDNQRNKLYVCFENLGINKHLVIKEVGNKLGFRVRDNRRQSIRIETTKENKLQMFRDFVDCVLEKKNQIKIPLRAMGISNWCKDANTNKIYSIQFYDYDYPEGKNISQKTLERILEIFPLDCLMYETEQGIHFISFAIRMGLRYTKTKAIETSKFFGNQDYFTTAKDLTLRVSPKWEVKRKKRVEISKKPKFKGLIKSPGKNIISGKHLDFYYKYMDLPEWVYDQYLDCDLRDYNIKVYHYKTSY